MTTAFEHKKEEYKLKYAAYYAKLEYYVSKYGIPKGAVEDIFHDILVKLHSDAELMKGIKSYDAFFNTCLHNGCLNYKNSARERYKQSLDECDDLPTNEDCPFLGLKKKESRTAVRGEVYNLQKKYRDVIILRYYFGLKNKEIAETLGISEKTVEGRMKQAKVILWKKLEYLLKE